MTWKYNYSYSEKIIYCNSEVEEIQIKLKEGKFIRINKLKGEKKLDSVEVELDETHYYFLLEASKTFYKDLTVNNDLMGNNIYRSILKNDLIFDVILPTYPLILRALMMIANMLIPYQFIDHEIELKSYLSQELLKAFFEKNSRIWYYIKKIARIILIFPSILISPFLIGLVIYGLGQTYGFNPRQVNLGKLFMNSKSDNSQS